MTATARRPWPMPWKMGLGFGLGLLLGLVVHLSVGADADWVQPCSATTSGARAGMSAGM